MSDDFPWPQPPPIYHHPSFARADLRALPPAFDAGPERPTRLPRVGTAAGPNRRGTAPHRPVRTRGNLAIPIAVFGVALWALRRWWR
jgi:hypothetical protein